MHPEEQGEGEGDGHGQPLPSGPGITGHSKPSLLLIFIVIIENADATPPHLDVFCALGKLRHMLGFMKFICCGK